MSTLKDIANTPRPNETAAHLRKRRRTSLIAAAIAVAVVAIALIWIARPWDSSEPDTGAGLTVAEKVSVSSEICNEIEQIQPAQKSYPSAPAPVLDGVVTFTFETNCGPLVIQSDAAITPITTNSMAFLAEDGYFDFTTCHRLTTAGIFVVQCGDPLATGVGGPGYQFEDEYVPEPVENNYPTGTVAMANAEPGTNGSQFFIVYQDTTLPPAYTIWGVVVEGMEMIQAVAANGVVGGGADGALNQPLQIQSVSLTK